MLMADLDMLQMHAGTVTLAKDAVPHVMINVRLAIMTIHVIVA